VAINSNVKTFTECIATFDELLNEMEEIIYPDLDVKDLQHFKDSNIALYATDKEPETLFREIFVELIQEIGMDGEKTFSPMDFEYYESYFKKGINLLMWNLNHVDKKEHHKKTYTPELLKDDTWQIVDKNNDYFQGTELECLQWIKLNKDKFKD